MVYKKLRVFKLKTERFMMQAQSVYEEISGEPYILLFRNDITLNLVKIRYTMIDVDTFPLSWSQDFWEIFVGFFQSSTY